MSTEKRLGFGVAAVLLPLALTPVLLQPTLAILLALGVLALALASRNVVYPIALLGLPAALIAFTGSDPLPAGGVSKVTAAWIVAGIALAVIRSDEELPLRILATPAIAATVVLAVWMFARLGPSLDASYGSRKLQLFVALDLVALVAGAVVARLRDRLELWVLVALVVSILGAVALLRGLLAGNATVGVGGRLALTGADSPIGLSRGAAEGVLLAVYILLASPSLGRRVLAFVGIPILAVAFTSGGSRGPVLGLLAGLAVLFLVVLRDPAAKKRVLLVVAGVLVAIPVVGQLVPGQDAGRTFSILTGSEGGLSSNGRNQLWSSAWHAFSAHPLGGIGTGSFHALGGAELYPHNLFLESAAEWGFVGLLLVAVVLGGSAAVLRRTAPLLHAGDLPQLGLVAALFVSALVNAMFSGDVTDNAAVWFGAGLSLGLARRVPLAELSFHWPLHARNRPAPGPPPQRTAAQARSQRQPAIVYPPHGSQVGGLVRVEVAVPPLSHGLVGTRLQWRTETRWRNVAESDERVYDVTATGMTVAVVRSAALAQTIAEAIDGEATPSSRHPWTAGRSCVVWNTARLAGMRGELRAACLDGYGDIYYSPPIFLGIAEAVPGEQRQELPLLVRLQRSAATLEDRAVKARRRRRRA